ncbi:hypothetical protein R3X27_18660 [Tropicimonas sp. TH_r6]|uniref:hypothetical protein n=1 Tax=Tropicimonas sp. TH_r6 TaxID=3082085 RepID=UPI0029534780|nr:hypothetical protein [Tropicimonas sp. TH_r6]MDV7144707.1 hypothetical protein [Tropicimonas sp. TH_r6]
MPSGHSSLSPNLFLAGAIILCGVAVSGSWEAVQQKEAKGQPHKVVTLGQSMGHCSSKNLKSGLNMVSCTEGKRGEKRGGGFFMKPPQ